MATRTLGVVCALGALAAGLMFVAYLVRDNQQRLSFAAPTKPAVEVVFESDGVLSRGWFAEHFRDPGKPLREIDLRSLKEGIERHGQIHSARVSVRLPDQLIVRVQEREPILRARLQPSDADPIDLLIASDGTVYAGSDYPAQALARLPYIAGIRVSREGDGFQSLQGMETLAELLRLARVEAPELYRGWRVVSCEQYDGDPYALNAVLRVRGRHVREAVFLPHDFGPQLERLKQVVEHARREGVGPPLHRVDLTLDSRAVVQVTAPESVSTNVRGNRSF